MASYDDTTIVSGSVVGFSNGADSVPLKNWQVTLPASLTGYSAIGCTKSGKNLIDLSSLVDGYVNSNGTFNTNHSKGEMRSGFIPVKPDTTYYFSIVETTGTEDAWVGIGEYTSNDGTGFIRRDSFWRFTTSSTAKYVVVSARNLAQATKIQLEIGNDPTTWEAYTPITQYTATLGRTIYGGTADVVKGEGTDGFGKVTDFSALSANGISSTGAYRYRLNVTNCGDYSVGESVSNVLTYNRSFNGGVGDQYNANGYLNIFLSEDNVTDAIAYLHNNNVEIVYPYATATDFTFTPLSPTPETPLGVSNFWSDQGNTELTYYKDGYGFTSVTVHKETPDGEPIEETRKLHRIIYEGQVDVINGTGLIYRGESGTQYDPPEQISFTPIEVSTDEGENTLYADEGDSAITYRKAVD